MGGGDAVFDLGEVDQAAGDFDGAFGGERGGDVFVVVLRRGIEVDGVHIDERGLRSAEVGDAGGLDAGFEGVVVPACCTFSAAEYELDIGIEHFECFRPLVCLGGVAFLRHFFDLPWTPHLVSQSPVFDFVRLRTPILAA